MHQEQRTGKTRISLWVNSNVLKNLLRTKHRSVQGLAKMCVLFFQTASPSQTLKSVEAGSLAKNNVYSCRRLMVRQMG